VNQRILLLVTDLEIGGTPTVVRELAIRLRGRGHDVQVACLGRWGPVADQLRAAGVNVTALEARGSTSLQIIPKFVGLLNKQKIDTVLSFLVHANAVAAVASLFTRNIRYLQSIQTTQRRPSWHWHVQAIAALRAERVVVPSPSVSLAARDYSFIAEKKIWVIPNAIDLADFDLAHVKHSHDHRVGGKFRIGFIGRLDPIKRIGDLIEAAGRLREEIHVDIYGEGGERPRIERLIHDLNLTAQVTMHGAIDRPQGALAHLDALVLPSEAEGFGLVLIESMAARVPVIATNAPGICDVVKDRVTGLLVPIGSPVALADAIDLLIKDRRLRLGLSENALAHVRDHFTWEIVLPQYEQILLASASSPSPAAPDR
jgi:glycosyltransferase involved in cell wall biosynthesis